MNSQIRTLTTNRQGLTIIMSDAARKVHASISVSFMPCNDGGLFSRTHFNSNVYAVMRFDDQVVLEECVGRAKTYAEANKIVRAYIKEHNLRQRCRDFIRRQAE